MHPATIPEITPPGVTLSLNHNADTRAGIVTAPKMENTIESTPKID